MYKTFIPCVRVTRNSFNNVGFLRIFKESSNFNRAYFNISKVKEKPLNNINIRSVSCENEVNGSVLESLADKNLYVDMIDSGNLIKDLLYPESTDPIILNLNNCEHQDEIFEILNENKTSTEHKHLVQAIIVLWHLQKCDTVIETHSHHQNVNPDLKELLVKLHSSIKAMNPNELTCSLLYLNKLGISLQHSTLQEIISECLQLLNTKDKSTFPLTALSRLFVAVNSVRGIYPYFICKDAIPAVIEYLTNCTDSEEFRLVTISLTHMHQLVTNDILQLYKKKVEELIRLDQITTQHIGCILKAVNFLNFPYWSQQNTGLIRDLSLKLINNINEFQTREIVSLFKVFQSQLEPAELIPLIAAQSLKLLENDPSSELLACAVLFTLPDQRVAMTKIAKDIVYSKTKRPSSAMLLPSLFKALRLLKISNLDLCNAYWTEVLNEILSNPKEREVYRIGRFCYRYMHFNNNLGGTYRHLEYERTLISLILDEIKNGLSSMIPSSFAKLSSFAIAYGESIDFKNQIPEFIVSKLEEMSKQFTVIDCLHISRGLQISLEMKYKYYMPKMFASQFLRIETVLNEAAERHIRSDNLSLIDLNSIIRAYNNRKSSVKTNLFQKIIRKYETVPDPLTSRLIRDITFNLNSSGYKIPTMCEKMLDYINNNKEYVIGDTVEKVLYCCYNLGHNTEKEEVFTSAVKIIHRDFNFMSGLAIVQACLSLSFYKVLPGNMISRVFSINFIKRLEEEIKMSYSKATYPERVFNQVMQLNRSVCLDFPESNVPWFQQNYIEAQISKVPIIRNKFNIEIKRALLSMVPSEDFLITDHVTPYGYRIEFVLHLDKYHVFQIPSRSVKFENITRIAILLLKLDAFCENSFYFLRGHETLRQRHLELLGYKVVHVKFHEWNSMHMNLSGEKLGYLKSLINP